MTHSEAEVFIGQLGKVKELAVHIHSALVKLGCDSYVKTIYVGYEIGGEMVAAMYGHADHLEIALALPEDEQSDLLVDASHLTWRTLPVAALVRRKSQVAKFTKLATSACERVRSASHDVMRDNDFFIKAREARRHRN